MTTNTAEILKKYDPRFVELDGAERKANEKPIHFYRLLDDQTRPLLDSYAEVLVQREQFEQEKIDVYQAGVLSVVDNLSEHWGKVFTNASAGLTDPEHLKELEFWEETFQEPLRAIKEAIAVNGSLLNKLGKG